MTIVNKKSELKNCTQDKCAFLQVGQGCRVCDTCNAEPYLLDDNCYRCWNCSKDEGVLRWNNNFDENNLENTIKNKKFKKMLVTTPEI